MEECKVGPSLEQALEFAREYVNRDVTMQLNGLCSVHYQGRAKSKLDRGERIVMKKQDSAFLVHGPENYQPRNWQPEVDSWSLGIEDEKLVVRALRTDPEEVVEVRFDRVDFAAAQKLVDRSSLRVKGIEVDIHDSIEEDPGIIEEGMKIVEREKSTPAGSIDLFCRDSEGRFVVLEVKRNPNYNSVLQLQRYVEKVDKEFSSEVRGILVSPKATENLLEYLEERGLEFSEICMEEVIESYDAIERSQQGLDQY